MGASVVFVGPKWRGAYSGATAYNVNDLATDTASGIVNVYIALLGSTGQTPHSSPTYWSIFAPGGVAGSAGPVSTTGSPASGQIAKFSGASSITTAVADDLSTPIYAVASGTNTITATLSPAISAYTAGTMYRIKCPNANTGAVTVNLNSVGAVALTKVQGGVTTALIANDIQAGQMACFVYDGTQMQMVSQLGNTPSGGASIVGGWVTSGSYASLFGANFASASLGAGDGHPMPRATVVSNLYAYVQSNNGGHAYTLTMYKNGSATTLTVSSGSGLPQSDTTHSVTFAAGDILSFVYTSSYGYACMFSLTTS